MTKFDQCIERLHITDENNLSHPITDGKWSGDNETWLRWRRYIIDRFALPNANVNVKKVRDAILASIAPSSDISVPGLQ